MNTQEKYKLLDKIEDIECALTALVSIIFEIRKQLERDL